MFSKAQILLAIAAISGSFAAAPAAFSQTLNAAFDGDIAGECTQTMNSPGALAADPFQSPPSIITSAYFAPGNGSAAIVEVDCNNPAQIYLDSITQTNGPDADPAGTEYNVRVGNQFNGSESLNATATPGVSMGTPLPIDNNINTGFVDPGNNTLAVDMVVNRNSATNGNPFFQGGNYGYEVQFTIAP